MVVKSFLFLYIQDFVFILCAPNPQLINTLYSRDISLFLSLSREDVELTSTTATQLISTKNVLFV